MFVWAWASLLVDLLFPLYMGWGRSRPWGLAALLSFHLLNAYWFHIGVFPWLMIAASLIWLPPDWPRAVLPALRAGLRPSAAVILAGLAASGLSCWALGWFSPVPVLAAGAAGAVMAVSLRSSLPVAGPVRRASVLPAWGCALLAGWLLLQVAVPLRHWAVPGDVAWTEEGHNFSWRMKLRDKDARVVVVVQREPGGVSEVLDPLQAPPAVRLTRRQLRKMSTRPHLMVQYSHRIRDHLELASVRFHSRASLNRGPWGPLVDSSVDLSSVPYPWWGHAGWIVPRPQGMGTFIFRREVGE